MSMFQARFHGRGGQGVVTAAEMLSVAAFLEGKHAQAFPSFGSERMGAPVVSFCRIADHEIRLREPVLEPDALIIQDPTLLFSVDVFHGLTEKGWVIINSSKGITELGIDSLVERLPAGHVRTLAATELALKHIGRPLPNAVMLGGLAAMSGVIRLESVIAAISEAFPGPVGQSNIAAATAAHEILAASQKDKVAC
ncbi:2-oxoacid:acceptor oxidoreductase family protein [Telmatospirillum sp.]|uniref:2-oxoacid:acceptor oxidoreductase family protein n=1 Tax=Telmatospirillum sp. TaxID=2079197 RepID=UPI00284F5272|nr:2-oxoacid:acceptor oxidoreductase family protein [Telmatospirillum sp.]MDR3436931.1 2-oxoacid:acceptor oxidoreductase family protein [Telmatospirillum sp.]